MYCIKTPDALYCILDTKQTALMLTQNEREDNHATIRLEGTLKNHLGHHLRVKPS